MYAFGRFRQILIKGNQKDDGRIESLLRIVSSSNVQETKTKARPLGIFTTI